MIKDHPKGGRKVERYICIHGHFYQPSREDPWSGEVPREESASPHHDWNERITAECYGPMTVARIVNEAENSVRVANNFARMSFDVGPTLLSWLENHAPRVYQSILNADRNSRKRFSNHGSAIAQAYNHIILPLANLRDKWTQLYWASRDFEFRFGRQSEGIWLPETAVDLETLDMAAKLGFKFTILSPHQASRVRTKKAGRWKDVSDARIDPTMAYEIALPSGRPFSLFFFDGPVSRAVAFENMLADGETFIKRLLVPFSARCTWPPLVNIASDGETYGHHHKFGEMALAYVLEKIDWRGLATLTNYGEYLERRPPTHVVEIVENTSWSCAHGVERWRGDCGCHIGGKQDWNQLWRKPLRETLDWLRDELIGPYESRMSALVKDPWDARNEYISLILDPSPENSNRFLAEHAGRTLSEAEKQIVPNLLKMQKHLMFMFTSCGWFFDDPTGLETALVLRHAARALELARIALGKNLEEGFLGRLSRMKSNVDPSFRFRLVKTL